MKKRDEEVKDDGFVRVDQKIAEELQGRFVRMIPPEREKFILKKMFEKKVYEAFSFNREDGSQFEVEIAEGGKCLALGLFKASLFHFQSAMKVAATIYSQYAEVLPAHGGPEISTIEESIKRFEEKEPSIPEKDRVLNIIEIMRPLVEKIAGITSALKVTCEYSVRFSNKTWVDH